MYRPRFTVRHRTGELHAPCRPGPRRSQCHSCAGLDRSRSKIASRQAETEEGEARPGALSRDDDAAITYATTPPDLTP